MGNELSGLTAQGKKPSLEMREHSRRAYADHLLSSVNESRRESLQLLQDAFRAVGSRLGLGCLLGSAGPLAVAVGDHCCLGRQRGG